MKWRIWNGVGDSLPMVTLLGLGVCGVRPMEDEDRAEHFQRRLTWTVEKLELKRQWWCVDWMGLLGNSWWTVFGRELRKVVHSPKGRCTGRKLPELSAQLSMSNCFLEVMIVSVRNNRSILDPPGWASVMLTSLEPTLPQMAAPLCHSGLLWIKGPNLTDVSITYWHGVSPATVGWECWWD